MGTSFRILFVCLLLLNSHAAVASESILNRAKNWTDFDRLVNEENEKDDTEGISYIVSGAVTTIGGLIGYNSSVDVFSKAVYGLSQTIGIAAIGYGGFKMTVGNEHRSFHNAIGSTSGLTAAQRDAVLASYVKSKESERKLSNKIRLITHGLVAALNFYNGSREGSADVKTAFYFVGGVNLLAAVTFAF